jgi:type II secretory pathway component PulJ
VRKGPTDKKGFTAAPDSAREGGFTLLEMVIAITLVATIVVVIMGAMRLGYRSIASGEKKMETLERFRSSLTIIDAQIQSAVPLTQEQDGAKHFYFKGARTALSLVTNYSIWGGRRGHVLVDYRVDYDEKGKLVLFASEGTVGTLQKRTTVLLKGFDQIFFEYWYIDPTEETGRWVDQWTEEAKTPARVRLWMVSGGRQLSVIIPMPAEGTISRLDFGTAIHLASAPCRPESPGVIWGRQGRAA